MRRNLSYYCLLAPRIYIFVLRAHPVRLALPVAAFLEMLTKSVNLRATAATRTGCVRSGVGHQTPFSGRGSRNAVEDLRPNIFQLNTEGLTADKISVIEQLAYKNKAFIIVLQETHCTTADKLVIPNISPAGSFLSRGNAGVLNLFSPVYPLPAS